MIQRSLKVLFKQYTSCSVCRTSTGSQYTTVQLAPRAACACTDAFAFSRKGIWSWKFARYAIFKFREHQSKCGVYM